MSTGNDKTSRENKVRKIINVDSVSAVFPTVCFEGLCCSPKRE